MVKYRVSLDKRDIYGVHFGDSLGGKTKVDNKKSRQR